MNKEALIDAIADGALLSKTEAKRALNAAIEAISQELSKGGDVSLPGFGSFNVKSRAARAGRNPSTGKPIEIASKRVPTFKPGATLRNAVN